MNHQRSDDGVLVIYTGGTIGSLPKVRTDPLSSLVPAPIEEVMELIPNYDRRDHKLFTGGRWVRLGTHSWEVPIDSSNIQLSDWVEIARVIRRNYKDYDGFVVLHGTDTLAYTSSALSFMLNSLSKPVVITGSQKPIGETRSDAVQNVVTSIEIAAGVNGVVVPEVCVFFRDRLFRGCRTTKVSASSYAAFDSPNYPPLGVAGEHIVIHPSTLRRPAVQTLSIVEELEPNIASIDVFPGISASLLNNLLATEGLRGVVLQTFGTGNAPSNREFLLAVAKAVDAGKMIVDITQCRAGEVELGLYDVSAGLLSLGVVSGMDMTPEAALTKMFVVLASESDVGVASDKMQLNLKGEQRQSIFNLHFEAGEAPDDGTPVTRNSLRPMVGASRYDATALDRALFRIMGLEIPDRARGRIEFKAYIDLPEADEDTPERSNPHFLGAGSRKYDETTGPESVFFSIHKQALEFIDNQHPNTITIVSTAGTRIKWSKLNIALFANC